MTKKLLLFLTCLFPVFLFAQSAFSDCDHVFTKVQHLPSLKISDEAFEDTLATVLTSKKFPLKETILNLADLWKPATQNGYDVCAYVSLKLKFVDNKINIEIMQ